MLSAGPTAAPASASTEPVDVQLLSLTDHMMKGKCLGKAGADGCFTDSTGRRFRGADFPFSTGNIVSKDTGKRILKPYNIEWVKGSKGRLIPVGFIDLTVPDTPTGSTSYQPQLKSLPLLETANKYAAELKRRGVKAIVANVHDGGTADGAGYNGCGNPRGPVIDTKAVNYPVTRDVTPDPDVATMVNYWVKKGAERYARPVATVTADITRVRNVHGESTLGDLAADAEYEDSHRTSGGKADLALVAAAPAQGSTALHGDLRYAKGTGAGDSDGTVQFGEAWYAFGYANPVLTVTVTGDQLHRALEQQWRAQPDGAVKFAPLAVSRNVRYTYDPARPTGDRVTAKS